jgi:hypothetical protein
LIDEETNVGIELIDNESFEDFVYFRVSIYLIQPDEESDSENKICDQCDVIVFRT